MLAIRRPQDLPLVRARCGEDALKLHARDLIRHPAVPILASDLGVEGFKTGSEDYRSHLQLHLLRPHQMVDRLGATSHDTLIALATYAATETSLRLFPCLLLC